MRSSSNLEVPRGGGVIAAKRLRAGLVLALVFFIAGFWAYFHTAPPGTVFHVVNADPEMAYFVSSLAVFKGQPYVYVDHPGTPLAVLGTALLGLTYPFHSSSPDGFVAGAVRHPGVFILMTHVVLVLANVACVLALGWKALAVRRWADAVFAAAVPASFFAFLPQSFAWTFYWSHNAVAFPLGTLLLLGSLVALRRGRPWPARTAWTLGLGAGVLTATQLYFATWAVGLAASSVALALLRPAWSRRAVGAALAVLAASAIGFAVCTAPMIPAYPRFVAFVRAVTSHQGSYGRGAAGFTSWKSWSANLAWLWDGAPALFIASGVVFAMLLAALVARRPRWRRDAGLWAAAAGLSLQWAVTLLLLAKHPSRFYLPAVAAMLPPLLAIALAFWRRGRTGRLVCLAVAAIVLLGFVRTAALSVAAHAERIAYRTAMDSDIDRYLSGYATSRGLSRQSVLVLWGPLLPDATCYGLWMGDQYSDRALHHEISRVCPSQGLAWSNITVLPEGWSTREEVPAVLITTEEAPRLFPAFAAFGEPELSAARNPAGDRLAFYRVSVQGGQARAELDAAGRR
jgi:hypothetical protein